MNELNYTASLLHKIDKLESEKKELKAEIDELKYTPPTVRLILDYLIFTGNDRTFANGQVNKIRK